MKILDFIGEHLDVIGPIAVGVVAALLTFKKVTAVIETVKAAMDSLNKVMAANPYALLIAGFAGLVTWSAALGNSYDNAREKAAELSSEEQELVNKISETNQAYEGRKQAISDAYADIDYEYSAAQSLADELQTIVDANGQIKDGYQERAQVIADELSSALGIELEIQGNTIQKL